MTTQRLHRAFEFAAVAICSLFLTLMVFWHVILPISRIVPRQ